MKIGWIGQCFGQHSVAWLARWLWGGIAERDDFEQFFYGIMFHREGDPLLEKIKACGTYRDCSGIASPSDIAAIIKADDINILIDLDSCTSDIAIGVLMERPAPVQCSWLGWDAPALGIDYVIGDPVVTPPENDEWYTPAKVLRLPTTHIAVAGFEVGVPHPKNRRQYMGIKPQEILYLCAAKPTKVSQPYMETCCEIMADTQSRLLIKHGDRNEMYRERWLSIAQNYDISPDRFLFMPRDDSSEEWRANMAIADCLLDTFPYSGCTTVIEALWLGVPVVTLAGKGYHARTGASAVLSADVYQIPCSSINNYEKSAQYIAAPRVSPRDLSAPLWDIEQFISDFVELLRQIA